MYRSAEGGDTWQPVSQDVPAHLEAGPLARDPVNPSTLYAGFTLIPYSELWRMAIESRGRLERIDPGKLWPWVAALIGGGALAYKTHANEGRPGRRMLAERLQELGVKKFRPFSNQRYRV